jgi:hypothetical protein
LVYRRQEGDRMNYQPPRILIDSLSKGTWKQVTPDAIRRCLGDDLDDLKLFDSLYLMELMSSVLDNAGYVNDPGFCMNREDNLAPEDPRLEFPRALFIAGSIVPGDDVFVAIRREDSDEYDPSVLVLDWRRKAPYRWTERGRLSELISCIGLEC